MHSAELPLHPQSVRLAPAVLADLDLPHEAAPLQPLIEELLVKWSDFLTPFEVCTVEGDEISVLREDRSEGSATALVPAIHQLLIEGADGCLVS
jgi:hypothetical protein